MKNVTRPEHYTSYGVIEPIEYINSHNFNFNIGNVIKYVTRAGKKEGNSTIQDLAKAVQYLEFEIDRIKGGIVIEQEDVEQMQTDINEYCSLPFD